MVLARCTSLGFRSCSIFLALSIISIGFCQSSASAYSPGVANGNPFGGGKAAVNDGSSGSGFSGRSKKSRDVEKPALPAAVTVAEWDEAKLLKALGQLDSSPEAAKKAEELVKRLSTERAKVVKAQADARAAYEKATTQDQVMAAGRDVMTAAEACRNFNAMRSFESGIRNLLSLEQQSKLKKILAG